MSDINKLIDLAKSAKKIQWTEEDKKIKDIHNFLLTFNIVSGTNEYEKIILELLYESWSKKPVKPRTFHKEMKKKIKFINNTYCIDDTALKIDRQSMLNSIGSAMMKRVSDGQEEKEEEST